MTLSQTLALWADRLRDISSIGLLFADNIYHRQRYEALQDIALEMFALATGELPEQLEPLRATVMRQPSAISTADAAIIDLASPPVSLHVPLPAAGRRPASGSSEPRQRDARHGLVRRA